MLTTAFPAVAGAAFAGQSLPAGAADCAIPQAAEQAQPLQPTRNTSTNTATR